MSARHAPLAVLLFVTGAMLVAGAGAGKWPTDEAVRRGMATIRDLVVAHHTLITHRRLPRAAAVRLASDIKATAEAVGGATSLAGEARADLDGLLARIVAAANDVRGGQAREPIDALIDIDDALQAYAARFDHPGWRPLREP